MLLNSPKRRSYPLICLLLALTLGGVAKAFDPNKIDWESVTSEFTWIHFLGSKKMLALHLGDFPAIKKIGSHTEYGPTPFPPGKNACKIIDLTDGARALSEFAIDVKEQTSYLLLTYTEGSTVKNSMLSGTKNRDSLQSASIRVLPLIPGLEIAWDTSTDKAVSEVVGTPLKGESPFKPELGFRQTLLIKNPASRATTAESENPEDANAEQITELKIWIPKDSNPSRWVLIVHPSADGTSIEASAADIGGHGVYLIQELAAISDFRNSDEDEEGDNASQDDDPNDV